VRQPQFVYFIRPVGMDGPIKIGCSKQPLSRLKTFSTWSPFPLELIGSAIGDFDDENRLHRRFSDLHTRKEWFMSSPLLRDTIERILAGTPVEEACRDIAAKGPIRIRKLVDRSEDRELFLSYGRKIKAASSGVWRGGQKDRHYVPHDIKTVMHNWRMDRVHDHLPVIPTKEQFARMDEFIENPAPFCVEEPWYGPNGPKVSRQKHTVSSGLPA
jgi:T5orf172 domain